MMNDNVSHLVNANVSHLMNESMRLLNDNMSLLMNGSNNNATDGIFHSFNIILIIFLF